MRTPTRPFSRRQPLKLRLLPGFARLPLDLVAIGLLPSPALGLEVLHVDVLAHASVGDHLADVLAVLDDRSPFLSALSATLWPIGMSCLALSFSVVSVSVMTPSMSVPALRPSTTTTPTLSLGL